MARTLNNCSVIKNFQFLVLDKPKQENGICYGYNNKYYQIDGKFEACDKCRFNNKNK